MNDNTNLDVLIVGGGPAGTTLGIELRRRGIDVRIVDKASSGFAGSRAKGIQPRTLEIMEDLGALDDILDGGSLYPRMGIHAGPLVVPWAMIKVNKPSERVPYPSTWLIPQHRTDRALHHRLEELGGRIDYQCEVYDLEQDENGVTVEISTPTGDEAVRAKFVVGADGGSSVVRKSVGIAFEGTTDEEDRMLIVDAVVEGDLSRKYWHIWPVGGKFVGACPLPDSNLFQWMIKLDPDETPPTTAEAITGRV
ncbi:MAG: FAD-dependent monooxygenase, partial [Rhodococcus sp. (in: high G+C Gram-positive bacteria)]